jgi:hypothetical protein
VIGGVGKGLKVEMKIINNGRLGMEECIDGKMSDVKKKDVDNDKNRIKLGSSIE